MGTEFEAGMIPTDVRQYVLPRLEDMQGLWLEVHKPQEDLLKILARLGINGVKRRLVARARSKFEIRRLWPPIVDFTKIEDREPDSTRSDTEATTEPSSPVKAVESKARWYQKQQLPMGRFVEGELVTGAADEAEHIDPETGSWMCQAIIIEDVLIQKRFSEKLGVTTFETRALVDRKFNIDREDKSIACDEPTNSDGSLMYFQWTLVDHRNADEKITSCFFLERMKEENE